ncbi:MAG: glycosyltransferase family 9 protein [Gammaproteobacteria bacterium]|nr:glycosyltransferase family 9 protein [Gammaproteobacteria bacterium]
MRVLIIKLGALGDAIVATPAIRAIIEAHPQNNLSLLTSTEYAELFSGLENVEIVSFPRHGIREALRCILWLRKKNFDRIYDLQSNDRSRLYCCLSGAKEKVGNHSLFPYTHHPGDKYTGQTHVSRRHKEALQSIGIETKELQPWLPVNKETKARVADWLGKKTSNNKKLVLIHAGASHAHPQKRWPYFAEIGKKLCLSGFEIIWLGGKDEEELNAQLARVAGINATGEFGLGEIVELGKSACFALTNDSGPMHLLSCANLPVYALFGPTDWRRYHALGQIDNVISLSKPSPVWSEESIAEMDKKNLSRLSPEMVWAVLAELENITE